jgi:UDP-glucuronate decarboxylase
VDDTIQAMQLMMETSKGVIGPINFGNPEEYTIFELANLILELTASKSKLCFKPAGADDPLKRQPDIELAQKELSWHPKLALKEGLQKTIAYFKSYLN